MTAIANMFTRSAPVTPEKVQGSDQGGQATPLRRAASDAEFTNVSAPEARVISVDEHLERYEKQMADLNQQIALLSVRLADVHNGRDAKAEQGNATLQLEIERLRKELAGAVETHQLFVNAKKALGHAHASVVETLSEMGGRFIDALLGMQAISKNPVGDIAPFGIDFGRGVFAFRCFADVGLLPSKIREAGAALGDLLLDPALDTLAGLGAKTASLAQIATRAGYLGAMLGMLSFPPVLHLVNIAATGVCGTVGALSELNNYRIALACKRGGEVGAQSRQIAALLRVASNVALVAFAVLSAQAAVMSLVPLTMATGLTLSLSAGFSIFAKLYERWKASASVEAGQLQAV